MLLSHRSLCSQESCDVLFPRECGPHDRCIWQPASHPLLHNKLPPTRLTLPGAHPHPVNRSQQSQRPWGCHHSQAPPGRKAHFYACTLQKLAGGRRGIFKRGSWWLPVCPMAISAPPQAYGVFDFNAVPTTPTIRKPVCPLESATLKKGAF